MSSTPIFQHSNGVSLAPLLDTYLPISLPIQNALSAPDVAVWATFPPAELPPAGEKAWLVLVDYGNQLRFFAPAEGSADLAELEEGEQVVVGALKEMLRLLGEREGPVKLGGFHECWLPALQREFAFLDAPGMYRTFLPREGEALAPAPPVPQGITVGPVRAEDINEVLATSEVAHPPAYLLSRLPHSTALFTPADRPGEPPRMLAHCFTHRDGSLGTLHVVPDRRRQGLGTLVALLRAEASGGRMLAHVSDKNVESRALMRGLGWEGRWVCGWVRVK